MAAATACRFRCLPTVGNHDQSEVLLDPPAAPESADLRAEVERWPELVARLQSELDEERGRVARELHDELGGALVAAKMDMSHLERGLGAERPELRARIAQVQENLDAAIAVQRRLVERLQPGLLVHVGLFAALRGYVDELNVQNGGGYQVSVPADELALELPVRVALYRAAQDALALGQGTLDLPVELRTLVRPGALALEVFHPQAARADQDLRLLRIAQRVKNVGGDFTVERSDAVTCLIVGLPSCNA